MYNLKQRAQDNVFTKTWEKTGKSKQNFGVDLGSLLQ